MALRHRKPTSAGRRFQTVSDFAEITATRPEKSLLDSKPKTGGRNNRGRITSRFIVANPSGENGAHDRARPFPRVIADRHRDRQHRSV